jgi:hypothetical protein
VLLYEVPIPEYTVVPVLQLAGVDVVELTTLYAEVAWRPTPESVAAGHERFTCEALTAAAENVPAPSVGGVASTITVTGPLYALTLPTASFAHAYSV